jgi:hypothetical protein
MKFSTHRTVTLIVLACLSKLGAGVHRVGPPALMSRARLSKELDAVRENLQKLVVSASPVETSSSEHSYTQEDVDALESEGNLAIFR